MNYKRYDYTRTEESTIFEFISIGLREKVRKIVQFTAMSVEHVYNLGFGDYDEATGAVDDEVVTNNGDSLKVLATVVATVYDFTAKYPKSRIFATGSNEVRTRLYRMGITKNLEEIKQDFYVYGMLHDGVLEPFIAGEDYIGFLVSRKKH